MSDISEHIRMTRSLKENIERDMQHIQEIYDHLSEKMQEPEFWEHFKALVTFQKLSDKEVIEMLKSKLDINREKIDFLAIDGTRAVEQKTNYFIFFAGAFGQEGIITLDSGRNQILVEYEAYKPGFEPCMVAFVPVPDMQIPDTVGQGVIVPDAESDFAEDLFNIHNRLMTLAELFLGVKHIQKDENLKIVMLDRRLSGLQASVVFRRLRPEDEPAIRLLKSPIARKMGLTITDLNTARVFIYMLSTSHGIKIPPTLGPDDVSTIKGFSSYELHWERCKELFEHLCEEIFLKKNVDALKTEEQDPKTGQTIRRYFTPADFDILITIGLHYLLDLVMRRKILLIGLIKATGARYFTRNMFQTMAYYYANALGGIADLDIYKGLDQLSAYLFWSDILTLRVVAGSHLRDKYPWTTVEYDSIFQTLAMRDVGGTKKPTGVMMRYLAPSGIFLQSYVQLTHPTSYSFVWPIERVYLKNEGEHVQQVEVKVHLMGKDEKADILVSDGENPYNLMILHLLRKLTHNRYPDAYGYPTPLFKADKVAYAHSVIARKVIQAFPVSMLSVGYRKIRGR